MYMPVYWNSSTLLKPWEKSRYSVLFLCQNLKRGKYSKLQAITYFPWIRIRHLFIMQSIYPPKRDCHKNDTFKIFQSIGTNFFLCTEIKPYRLGHLFFSSRSSSGLPNDCSSGKLAFRTFLGHLHSRFGAGHYNSSISLIIWFNYSSFNVEISQEYLKERKKRKITHLEYEFDLILKLLLLIQHRLWFNSQFQDNINLCVHSFIFQFLVKAVGGSSCLAIPHWFDTGFRPTTENHSLPKVFVYWVS
jgi:hypothetical protein